MKTKAKKEYKNKKFLNIGIFFVTKQYTLNNKKFRRYIVMQVTTSKEKLCINQVIGKKTETAMVEEDFVVPDIKPDILNTIHTNGTVCIYKKEVMDGKIRLDGCINTYIMYLADDENMAVRGLNTTLEFSKTVDFENVREGMILEDKVNLKSVECRVLNGRKVNIKAIIEMDLKVTSNEEVEFVKQVDDLKDVQLLNENLTVNSLLGSGLTKIFAKDTIIIDSIDNLSDIMKADINIINKEIKVSYNKVLVKADSFVKIVYLTDDGRINSVNQLIPIMGFIDLPDVTDENVCDVNYQIKNFIIKPNSVEEHSIYVEAELEVTCNVYETRTINVIQDLYSPSVNLEYKQKQIRAMSQKEIMKEIYTLNEKEYIQEIGNNRIYDVELKPTIIKQTVLRGRIVYEGEVEARFIYSSKDSNNVNKKDIILPFSYNVDCNNVNSNSEVETNVEVTTQDFTVMPDESIDVKVNLDFTINMSDNKEINVIEEISVDEKRDTPRYSLVIYFVKKGDTLWNIAKKFNSTIDNIVRINQIEDENKINIGEQLFIPIAV